jgi:hypothetical protein
MTDPMTLSDIGALSRWDSEGGATPSGPQQSAVPAADFATVESPAHVRESEAKAFSLARCKRSGTLAPIPGNATARVGPVQ